MENRIKILKDIAEMHSKDKRYAIVESVPLCVVRLDDGTMLHMWFDTDGRFRRMETRNGVVFGLDYDFIL